MNFTKITAIGLALSLLAMTSQSAFAQNETKAMSMNELLRQVEQGRVTDNKENKARESRFAKDKTEQQKLLNEAKREKGGAESRSQQLESDFETNDKQIAELTATLNARLGSLKELFGVMQQVSGDSQVRFENSLTNIQYPDRGVFLEGLAKRSAAARNCLRLGKSKDSGSNCSAK